MKKFTLGMAALSTLLWVSCSSDDDGNTGNEKPDIIAPTTYSFVRNETSTVSYSGQTTRIAMAEVLASSLLDPTQTEAALDGMFAHTQNTTNFDDPELNASNKSIRSKTAASIDFFSSNTTDASVIKGQFDQWIAAQVSEVFPVQNTIASAGVAGQLQEAGGGPTRYVNAKGLELDQAIAKSLIGGLMTDQILNNYLSPAILDQGDNRASNDNEILEEGKNYTSMEHKWDEAFGYLYGAETNGAVPTLNADSFLNKYLAKVALDPDFQGIETTIYDAFKLGRTAIVAKDYEVRDQQAQIIRREISKIIAIRAVYYLQQAKTNLEVDPASAFHDLSEGVGFIYSLQFTRIPNDSQPYFSLTEVTGFMDQLMSGNGFWEVDTVTLDQVSETIASAFDFTVIQAGS